jgi:hypothetical protein
LILQSQSHLPLPHGIDKESRSILIPLRMIQSNLLTSRLIALRDESRTLQERAAHKAPKPL